MATLDFILAGATTGIGSLPHHNIDSALEFAFGFDVPFLPQIPIRNPWEYSVPQALEGLPGVQIENDGTVLVDSSVWVGLAAAFDERLAHAFDQAIQPSAFEGFEPSAATSSSWQPFLWELQERKSTVAKVQLIGPLTAQWTLRSREGERMDHNPDVSRQIFRLVLARALGMTRRLKQIGVQPLLFLDEPALFVLSPENPAHLLGLQELRLLIQTLKKEGVIVGLHCCSNTRWEQVLTLGMDFLSFDTNLSLGSLLEAKDSLKTFLAEGGRLSLGAVPTSTPEAVRDADPRDLVRRLRDQLVEGLGDKAMTAMEQAVWTPACGLALHTPEGAQGVYSLLCDMRRAGTRPSTF